MGRKRKAGPKRKPGRPALPPEDKLSRVVSFKVNTAQAIGLGWVAKARGVTVAELVHGWVSAYLAAELKVLELRQALTKGKKARKDDE